MWVATQDLPRSAAHPFYTRLNQILDTHGFDGYVEGLCQCFYAEEGRPGLPPGRYFRLLLIGYFEGLDAERAIAWRAADSFALREFLGLVLPAAPPDHSTISRTRRLIDLETHQAVFTWILQRLADAGLVQGKTVGIDATTLEANAALRSIVRRDTGESYHDFFTAGVGDRDPELILLECINVELLHTDRPEALLPGAVFEVRQAGVGRPDDHEWRGTETGRWA